MLPDFRPYDEFSIDCQFGVTGAIIASSLIAAGTTAATAAVQSHQQNKAVDAQQAATNQAIAGLKPYQDTGTKAFQTLGSLMGLGGGPGGGGGGSALPSQQSGVTGPTTAPGLKSGAISDPSVLGGNAAQMPGGGGAAMATPGQLAPNPNASSYPGYTPHNAVIPQVNMRGPDGSTQAVPADQVSYWQQKGATVVHG